MTILRSVCDAILLPVGALYSYLKYVSFSVYMKYKHHTHIIFSARVWFDNTIGKYVYIGHNSAITKATVWNYCSIASNVSIGMWEHNLNKVSTNSIFYKNPYLELTQAPCIIWHDVWIWVGVVIRRWVSIWNWAVIWANSFVNSDIPPYAIAVWSPAKVIKYRFTPTQIKEIESTQWRMYDLKKSRYLIDKVDLSL